MNGPPQALADASRDPTLRGSPLVVYVWLIYNHLDQTELRPLKIEGAATVLRMKPDTVSRALRLLVDGGYLHREYKPRDGYWYRIRWARPAGKAA